MRDFSIIVATDTNRGIGSRNTLPWQLPEDMAYFKKTTVGNGRNAVIMGRKTYESIPAKFRPLANRHNIVVSRSSTFPVPPGVSLSGSLDDALQIASNYDATFVIGGSQLYELALHHSDCQTLYITAIASTFDCDAFFPDYRSIFQRQSSQPFQSTQLSGAFEVWVKHPALSSP